MTFTQLKNFLDEKVEFYNRPNFLENDPIQIPHQFTLLQDVEIAAFLTATIAWGNRKSILKSANQIMNYIDFSPYDFIMSFNENDTKHWKKSIHRTFNSDDLRYFCFALKQLYSKEKSLENYFLINDNEPNPFEAITRFRKIFFSLEHERRTQKHIANPKKNASCKRLNMMLRWLVRNDSCGVDFGIWKKIPMEKLSCPLDVHSGNTARKLNLLFRKQNDKKAVEELDNLLRKLDAKDPVKYDFALFGLSEQGY